MLPFLKKLQDASSSEPVPTQMRESDDEDDLDDYDEMEAVAEDLIRAIKSDDIKGIAEALHSAFQIYDSSPHIEGAHTNEKES